MFLLRRHRTGALDGWYSLPGGHLELGETITECATRECSEETGIEVENLKLRRIHSYLYRGDQGLNFIFTSKKWTGSPHISEPEFFNDGGFSCSTNYLLKLFPGLRVQLMDIEKIKMTSNW